VQAPEARTTLAGSSRRDRQIYVGGPTRYASGFAIVNVAFFYGDLRSGVDVELAVFETREAATGVYRKIRARWNRVLRTTDADPPERYRFENTTFRTRNTIVQWERAPRRSEDDFVRRCLKAQG
jgi:hypothetical protein